MKKKLSQLFSDFFRSIGIDPYLVFFLILIVLIAFKIKSYVDGKEKISGIICMTLYSSLLLSDY